MSEHSNRTLVKSCLVFRRNMIIFYHRTTRDNRAYHTVLQIVVHKIFPSQITGLEQFEGGSSILQIQPTTFHKDQFATVLQESFP